MVGMLACSSRVDLAVGEIEALARDQRLNHHSQSLNFQNQKTYVLVFTRQGNGNIMVAVATMDEAQPAKVVATTIYSFCTLK
jgi:hypothetical protein